MKKSELVVGEEYAVGRDLFRKYDREQTDHARCRYEGATLSGGVAFTVVEAGTADYYRSVVAGERLTMKTAREVRLPWATFAPLRDERRASEARRLAEAKRVEGVAADVGERLAAYGVAFGYGGWRLSLSSQARVSLTVDALDELLRRIDPVAAAEGVLAAVYSAHARDEEEYDAAADSALGMLRERLKVTDAELARRCAPDPESF